MEKSSGCIFQSANFAGTFQKKKKLYAWGVKKGLAATHAKRKKKGKRTSKPDRIKQR